LVREGLRGTVPLKAPKSVQENPRLWF